MMVVECFFLFQFQRATQDIHTTGKMHQAIMDDLGVILLALNFYFVIVTLEKVIAFSDFSFIEFCSILVVDSSSILGNNSYN